MATQRVSNHPLFVRLEQRNFAFRQVPKGSLFVETETTEEEQGFASLLEKEGEEQLEGFCAEGASGPRVFAHLLQVRTSPECHSLLLAFFDRLFDMDGVRMVRALLPEAGVLLETCSTILTMHASNHSHRPFLIRTTLLLMGSILAEVEAEVAGEHWRVFMQTAVNLLNLPLPSSGLALEGLKRAFRSGDMRQRFIDSEGVPILTRLIEASMKLSHTDTLYHGLFLVWELTFSFEGRLEFSKTEFVEVLGRLFSYVQPEKEDVVRLMFLIVERQMESQEFVENGYDVDLLKLGVGFRGKHYVDGEVGELVGRVCEELNQRLKRISLWDKYVREVHSGVLRNTVSHRSEMFWKSNIERFGENHYEILGELSELLESGDEETVMVACHDLGEYAARHPLGKAKIEEAGGKIRVMNLLSHKSQSIQREALRTTQLLLLRSSAV